MNPRSKKIFLALTIIIPFGIYCAVYYGRMIRNAPYNFSEFRSLTFKFGMGEDLVNQYTSADSTYRYLNREDSLVVTKVALTRAELQEIHRRAIDLGMWDFPETIGDRSSPAPHYYLALNYKRKTKVLLLDEAFAGDEKLRLAAKTMIDLVDQMLNDAEERQAPRQK